MLKATIIPIGMKGEIIHVCLKDLEVVAEGAGVGSPPPPPPPIGTTLETKIC